jgi:fumarate reductase subunit C
MKPLYKLVAFQVVVLAYILLILRNFSSVPFVYARLFVIFLAGAVVAFFVQGPQYGTMQPISTRPVMVFLGAVLMGAGLLWTLSLRGHL